LLFCLLAFSACSSDQETGGIHSIDELRQLFNDPPSVYRSAPLWDWNEEITEEGIDFQMKQFKQAGIGGVFVHPRPGLLTEYLSEEWFSLFDYTVRKGKELDMKVWIYDENSYPSGFAGGHVPAEMPDSYRNGASLRMYVQDHLDTLPSGDLEVILKQAGEEFVDISGRLGEEQGKQGTYYLFEKACPGTSPWYGGFSYVDLLYEGVTEKFMELTMTRGYERNQEDFGKTLMGVFTDEPNLEAAMTGGSVMRWTPDLWEAFRERWGYDLKVRLPSLVEETGDWKKVRHDYYELLLELFIDRWALPWSRYCDENKLDWTGHYWEHGWPVPTDGFDEAAFYIWHQMPGVDMLGNRLDSAGLGGQFGNDRAVRELRSAANQAGRRRTLSETYGGGGWEMDFEEQKRLADWQCVLGVNFVNQHLSYYSLNGVRKFDYPPSFSYHEPWWESYRLLGDYIGRISMAMSAGDQINRTLVLQPNTTAWMYFSRKVRNPEIYGIRNGFKHFVYRMEQQHLEYDLGSEYVLRTLGKVKGDRLSVGERDYSLVVIPAEMENLDRFTLDLLDFYLEKGGKVLSFGGKLIRVDGKESEEGSVLASRYPDQWYEAGDLEDPAALNLLRQEDFSMTEENPNGMLYHQRRVLEDGQLLFVVNSHKSRKAAATVVLEGKHVLRLDPVTGREYLFPCEREAGNVRFRVDLEPAGSALFAVVERKPAGMEAYPFPADEKVLPGSGEVRTGRDGDNIFVINYLDLKSRKEEQKDIYFMDGLIGLFRENGIDMGNPWQHKIQYRQDYLELDSLFGPESGFQAGYHFFIRDNLDEAALRSIRCVVERPGLWELQVNGHPLSKTEGAYWIDRDFPVYEAGPFLKSGWNTLTLTAPRMHILAEVMPVYLLGDFLVVPAEKGFEIAGGEEPSLGSWKEQGMPFYSQQVNYIQSFQVQDSTSSLYKVRLNHWKGSVAEVEVNGKPAGPIAWPPYELDVSGLLKPGENEITVQVTGSLKNTFGFFYHPNDSWIHGPHSWNEAPDQPPSPSDYYLMDYGMYEPFDLVSYVAESD
jgi:hypothetical protein